MKKRIIPLTKSMQKEFNRATSIAIAIIVAWFIIVVELIGRLSSAGALENTWLHIGVYVVAIASYQFALYPAVKKILYPTKFN